MGLMMARRRQAQENSGKKPEWYQKRLEARALRVKAREAQLEGMAEGEKKRRERMEAEGKALKESDAAARAQIVKNMDAQRNKKPMSQEELNKKREELKKKRDASVQLSRAKLAKVAAAGAKDSKQKAAAPKEPKAPPKGEVKDGSKQQGAAANT